MIGAPYLESVTHWEAEALSPTMLNLSDGHARHSLASHAIEPLVKEVRRNFGGPLAILPGDHFYWSRHPNTRVKNPGRDWIRLALMRDTTEVAAGAAILRRVLEKKRGVEHGDQPGTLLTSVSS